MNIWDNYGSEFHVAPFLLTLELPVILGTSRMELFGKHSPVIDGTMNARARRFFINVVSVHFDCYHKK